MEGSCRLLELKEGLILRIYEADIENEAGKGCSSRALDECQHRDNIALDSLVCWQVPSYGMQASCWLITWFSYRIQDTASSVSRCLNWGQVLHPPCAAPHRYRYGLDQASQLLPRQAPA